MAIFTGGGHDFRCGELITDVDGNQYRTILIGKQCWMAENLRTGRYQDGSPIAHVTDTGQWHAIRKGAWSTYGNLDANKDMYGKLYNWHAATDRRIICPEGWHLPNEAELTSLSNYLGSDAGFKLKSAAGWLSDGNGSNSSGFTGLPGGIRDRDGSFHHIGEMAGYWSSTRYDRESVWGWYLYRDDRKFENMWTDLNDGLSIRCVF